MKLTRDTRTGKILDNGTPVMLRGGHYSLFDRDNKPRRGLARPGSNTPFVVNYNGEPCVAQTPPCSPLPAQGAFRARLLTWSAADRWRQLFRSLNASSCNLLRVWVTGGTAVHDVRPWDFPFDLFPFRPVNRNRVWKWQVYHAVERGQWNNEYFERLAAFAEAADRAGVCLQVTLFNYFDLEDDAGSTGFKMWSRSPWNPDLSDNPASDPEWGDKHLVNPPAGSPPRDRHTFFIRPTNRLPRVQRALLNKVVQTLQGRGNIIIEVMNEPRFAPAADLSLFNANVIDRIRDAAPGWAPLISVNASRNPDVPGGFDTEHWRRHSRPGAPGFVPNYERVDLISYHKLTGFDDYPRVAGCENKRFSVPRVDPASIDERIQFHADAQRARPEKKSLMFSTDAARIDALEHFYCDVEHPGRRLDMHVRDGQIDTHLDHAGSGSMEKLALKSDLRNWAYWCFSRGLGPRLGTLHFQNHSEFQRSFYQMFLAWQEATGVTPPQPRPDDDLPPSPPGGGGRPGGPPDGRPRVA